MSRLTNDDDVLVVGGGLAAWRFVEELRRRGFTGAITVTSDETEPPYDRPPLSKQILAGKWPLDQARLATPERLAAANVALHLGDAAVAFDAATRTVTYASGVTRTAARIVLATGTRARHLPFGEGLVHYLRNANDVASIATALEGRESGHAVIIGGGFIGAESATALTGRGWRVTVLEAAPWPLVGVLGAQVAQWLSGLPAAAQVTLETNQRIANVVRRGDGLVIERESGPLEADLVIAGVGALPNVEWLDGSGLEIDNGVVVDEWAQATADIAALGDIARFTWTSVTGTSPVRIEHWQVASDHAARLAAHWLGESPTAPLIPYFWSDQYGKKIQVLGHPLASDDVQIVSGDVDNGAWLALYQRNGVVSGVVTLSQPRALMKSRPLLEVPTTLVEALDQSPWSA